MVREDLEKVLEFLKTKLPALMEALEKADPLTESYKNLLDAYNGTMVVITNINSTINYMIAQEMQTQMENIENKEAN